MLATCFSTAPVVSTSSRAIAAFERPSAISESTSVSRGVRRSSGPSTPPAREQLRDDLRIERGAAGRDAPHGVDEVVDVHDPVLQQVADATAAVGEQLRRVGLLDVLRDDQHPVPGRARAARAPRAGPRRGTSAAA